MQTEDIPVPEGEKSCLLQGGPDFLEAAPAACKPLRVSNHNKCHSNITRLSSTLLLQAKPMFLTEKERTLFHYFVFCLVNKTKVKISPPAITHPLNSDKQHRTASSEFVTLTKQRKAFFCSLKIIQLSAHL